MSLINKWWKRLLISFLGIGFLTEVISIIGGSNFSLGALGFVISIIIYLGLSILYGFHLRKIDKQSKNRE